MKDQRNKKVPLPMKVRQSTFDELDQTAKKMGIQNSFVVKLYSRLYAGGAVL